MDVAQDLVESLASEVEFEHAMEREGEVEDRLAVVWGRTTFDDRLWTAKGRVVCVHVAHQANQASACGHVDLAVFESRLVDLGPDWLVLEPSSSGNVVGQVIVPLAKVLGVSGLPEVAGRTARQSKIWEHRKLTQLLRPLSTSQQRVRVHSSLGCFTARVARVAADHIDFDLVDSPSRQNVGSMTVLFSSMSFLEANLEGASN
ncbi:MAG: hypothetical protein WAS05_00410 [Candidatus Nanopelagicales bacterium]